MANAFYYQRAFLQPILNAVNYTTSVNLINYYNNNGNINSQSTNNNMARASNEKNIHDENIEKISEDEQKNDSSDVNQLNEVDVTNTDAQVIPNDETHDKSLIEFEKSDSTVSDDKNLMSFDSDHCSQTEPAKQIATDIGDKMNIEENTNKSDGELSDEMTTAEELKPFELNGKLFIDFDEDDIEFGCLPQSNFNKTFKAGNSCRIYIAQIHTPYKIWFHTKENGDTTVDLMDSLEWGINIFE